MEFAYLFRSNPGMDGVTLIMVAMLPEVHLK